MAADGAMLDLEQKREVRRLFDQLCELATGDWQDALGTLGCDAAVLAEVRALLEARGGTFGEVRQHLVRMLEHAQAAELGSGDLLGPWRLVRELGSGGMGTVFLAERADGMYQRTVAIKLMHGITDAEHAARLQFERQVLAQLQLPGIARLYDGGTTPGGQPYLVMEYVQGVALDSYCRAHPQALRAWLRLFLQVCDIVRAAHERLVVHCDLKPENVLIGEDGWISASRDCSAMRSRPAPRAGSRRPMRRRNWPQASRSALPATSSAWA